MTHAGLAALMASTALLATGAGAQEAFELDEITVSGSLSPVETRRSGATVEVLEKEDLQGTHSDVIGRLTRLPGVHSTANGGLGASADIQIRGLPSRYVGVRVNGIDVANPSSVQNQYNFGGLTSAGIDRIEVLKGSQSALYGSEAIGGLVDITTYRPEKLGFSGEVSAEVGSFGTTIGALSAGARSERGVIALTYGRAQSEGISAQSSDTEADGFKQDSVTLFGQHEIAAGVTAGASLYYRDGQVELDRSRTDSTGELFTEELGGLVFTEIEIGSSRHRLSYGIFDVDRRDPTGFTRRFDGERRQISYLGMFDVTGQASVNFGLDHTEEEFSADSSSGSVETTSAQVELLYSPLDALDISAAIRHDDDSDFGGETTGRLAAVYRPVEDIALRAVVGSGFRAPSLFERFSPYGDPSLEPEQSVSYELGIEKTFAGTGSVRATYFYTEIDDLIDFDFGSTACASSFGCYNQVPGTTVSEGIELSGDYALTAALTLFGNYTYADVRNEGDRLVRTPRHDLTFGVDADLANGLSGTLEVSRVADVLPSEFAPAGNKVGSYTLVDLGLAYDVTETAQAYMRVENLFDEDYETAGGFNTPGRAIYLGVRASF